MVDVNIYHAWIGGGLLGVGLSRSEAINSALEEARNAKLIRPSLGEGDAPCFETDEDFLNALDIGSDWLSECSDKVIFLLETREIEE